MKEKNTDDFRSVVAEFGNLINDFGFSCPEKLWYPNLISLSKNVKDIYYCYVIARVYKTDGSLETTLWVGPINRPDDGLENLSANIKIQIGYTQVSDPLFFRNCESRIITLIESGILKTLLKDVQNELNHPSIKNRRYEVYTQYLLPFFLKVREAGGNDKSVMKDKKKCQALIENEFATLSSDKKVFFDQLGLKATQDKIWELCYIYSL